VKGLIKMDDFSLGCSEHTGLFTDYYELAMAAVYFQENINAPASFSAFIRDYPPNRGFFVAAGIEETLDALTNYQFTQECVEYLRINSVFSEDFLDYLKTFRFSGDVYAIPEGHIFFINEPVIEITAPLIEAQLVETLVLNLIGFQTLTATKSARCVLSAEGRSVVDFSMRRTQGTDAALKAARASIIGGCTATSNVLAGFSYNLDLSGTMAHSYVMSFEQEIDAFRAFAKMYRGKAVLLIDTYDTIKGACKAVTAAKESEKKGYRIYGVRLDSGNIIELSKEVRRIFDRENLHYLKIFASGGLDEYKIKEIIENGGCIDAFGVGTNMGVSQDAPSLDISYKMVSYNGIPKLKLSTGKKTIVGEKQIFRKYSRGEIVEDLIALRNEKAPEPEMKTLLIPVMKNGKKLREPEPLHKIQQRCRDDLEMLDKDYKKIIKPSCYPVSLTQELRNLQTETEQNVLD